MSYPPHLYHPKHRRLLLSNPNFALFLRSHLALSLELSAALDPDLLI
jgi:hypothetical protein